MSEDNYMVNEVLSRKTYGFPSNQSVYDAAGCELKLFSLDDKLVVPFGGNSYRKVRDVTLRQDDVMLIGYPKTGCHWTWEVLNMMVNKRAETSKFGKVLSFLEEVPLSLLENTPSPRVLNSHLWWGYLPRQLSEKKTKIILTYRNPKDTAVSFYHHHVSIPIIYHYNGKFQDWFPLYMDGQVDYGSYFDYYLSWDHVIKSNPDQPILVVSYEDMKEDLPKVIKKMATFLDLDLDDQLVEDIATSSGFTAMKKKYLESKSVSEILLRKGQVGDWKNWLTVAQSEAVDEKMKKLDGTLFSNQRYTLKDVMNVDTFVFPSNKSVFDADGVELKLCAVDDKLLPCLPETNYTRVKDIQLRDDDVLLLGYPKTGCHWTWEVLSMIVNKSPVISKIGKGAGFLEMATPEYIERLPSPRVLNTHLWRNYLPEQVAEKKIKSILTVRNPKDTAVSFYHHELTTQMSHGYNGTFKSWFQMYLDGTVEYGSYFDYYLEWDQDLTDNPNPPILVVRYEDMKEDLPREIRRMAAFLELSLDDDLVEEIAKAAGFDSMKKIYETRNPISGKLLRKGQVGDWKNWLTVAQSEAIDEEMKKLDGTRFADQNICVVIMFMCSFK
ncbi:uncharacterized protein LOC131934755 [Physella acuta]|uniref:uncharacterized protein LOC131934755 n=1 Tax=Physella acuta TaxID=109671 RepID=UPI0027DCE124|nr:uncharacterized protein LOC131934755 [Physella acuta]